MVTQLVIGMIFAICQDDTLMYRVQDYKVDCYEYYTSCVVNNGSDEKAVKRCEHESRLQVVK